MNPSFKILVADNDPVLLSATRRLLESAGYETFQALNAEDAFVALREIRPDLVLLDVNPEAPEALEVCRRIKADQSLAGIYVILLSESCTDTESRAKGLELGASDYIVRPVGNRELLARVQTMLRIQQVERALQASEKRFRALVENNSDAITLLDANGMVLYDSPAAPGMLGYSPEDWIGKDVFSLIHPDDLPKTQEVFQNLVKNPGECVRNTLRMRHKSGTWLWIELIATNLLSEPDVNAIVLNYHDITERKQAESLWQNFYNVLNASLNELYIFDAQTLKFEFVSAGAVNNLGYSLDDLRQMTPIDLKPEHTKETFRKLLQPLRTHTTQVVSFETNHKRADGSLYPVEVHLQLFDQIEHPVFLAVILDITARKKAELAFQASNAYLQAVLDSVTDAVFVDDADTGQILDVNQGMCEMYGYTRDEVLRISIGNLSQGEPPYSQTEALEWLRKAREIGPQTFEWLAKHKDGYLFWAEVNTRFAVIGGENRFVVVVRNINERKQAETAQRQDEQRMRAVIDNAPYGAFIYELMPDQRLVFRAANRAADSILGLECQQFVGKTIEEAFPPLTQTEIPDVYRRTAATGESYDNERVDYDAGNIRGAFEVHAFQIGPNQMAAFFRDITERKQAEEALKLSNDLLSLFIQHSPIYAFIKEVTPTESRVLKASENFEEMIGIPGSQMVGKSMQELFPPELAKTMTADDWSVASEGQVLNLEEELNGRSYTTIKFPIQLGRKHLLAGYTIDLTERKKAEQALRQSETFNRSILENSPIGISVRSQTGKLISANNAWRKIWAMPEANFLADQRKERQALNFDTRDNYLAPHIDAVRRVYEQGEHLHLPELKVTNPRPGAAEWIAQHFYAIQDEKGNVQQVVILTEDITERKQVEEELREMSERLAHMLANSPTVIYSLKVENGQANPVWISANIESVLGFKPEDGLQPEWWQKQIYSQDQPSALASLEHLFDDLYQHEYRFLRKDGETIWLHDEHRLLRNAGGMPWEIIGAWTDITERKQAEENIRKLNAELEQRVEARTLELRETQEKLVRQEKLAVLGQLAGSVGHELRNPLGIINNAVYFLRLVQPDAGETVKEYLGIIETETHTADMIISDLLDFSRVKSVDLEPVAVSELVSRTLERFPAPLNVRVSLELTKDLPNAYVDPRQMTQVLGNLVLNACQAMPQGGTLTLSAKKKYKMVALSVADTGSGITPENMKKLFEPLFTTKPKGIGLGLAVSKKLVEANGGKIEVQSEVSKGTTFTVWLPISKELGETSAQ